LTTAALSSSISALGGSDCSAQGIVQMQKLAFPSLDEPMLIEMLCGSGSARSNVIA
jgi:hypothetical protein